MKVKIQTKQKRLLIIIVASLFLCATASYECDPFVPLMVDSMLFLFVCECSNAPI